MEGRVDDVVGFDVVLLLPGEYPVVEYLSVLVTGCHEEQPKVTKLFVFQVIGIGSLCRGEEYLIGQFNDESDFLQIDMISFEAGQEDVEEILRNEYIFMI